MECRPLEITVGSAKDLKDVNLFSKMDVYAVASIKGDPFGADQKQKTHVDKDSGPNPNWGFPMTFTLHEESLQQNRLILKLEIFSDRSLGDREIGEVSVPIKELIDSCGGDGKKELKEVSYAVRTPSGKSKGTLHFSFKFGDKFSGPATEKPKTAEQPAMAYPAPMGYPGAGASSAGYPQPGAYPQQPYYGDAGKGHGYPYPPPGGYPPPPPQHAYGGYPPAPGYGGYPGYPQQPGYGGYGAMQPQKPKKNGGGGKMAMGLGAGLLGGLLVGDMISDVGDGGFDDGGFDGGFDF